MTTNAPWLSEKVGPSWDNGPTTKDGPGRCANTVIPGPRTISTEPKGA